MTKSKSHRAKVRRKKVSNRFSKLGFSGWAILFLSIAILTFIGSMIFNQSRAYRSEPSVRPVTIQLLNGCGENGACEDLANALLPGSDGFLYDVIEKTDAEFFGFEKTMVIDRRGDSGSGITPVAKAIASRMNIDEKEILHVKLAEDLLDIDVTIIAGNDYKDIVEILRLTKEEGL